MKIASHRSVDQKPVEMPGSSGCHVRWLIGKEDQAPNFAMREFQIDPGGHTPRHYHPYEHEVYVVSGEGTICEGEQIHRITAGDVILVQPDEVHQFRNDSQAPLVFLCMVPNTAYDLPISQAPECGSE